jgi:hypothetical protein
MRSLFGLVLVIFVPLLVRSQDRIHFQAEIVLHDTGSWSGYSKWYPGVNYGGPESRTLHLWYNDTLTIMGDSISGILQRNPGNLTSAFDRTTNTMRHVQIIGSYTPSSDEDQTHFTFTLILDSLPLERESDSKYALMKGNYDCHVSNSYSWGHPGGPEQSDLALTYSSGSGGDTGFVTVYVPTISSSVRYPIAKTIFHIISLSNGSVQIEGDPNAPIQTVEIIDHLGRTIRRANLESNSTRITSLIPGCYFARLGTEVAKFVVIP